LYLTGKERGRRWYASTQSENCAVQLLILTDAPIQNAGPSILARKKYEETWNKYDPRSEVHIASTIEEALELAKSIGGGDDGMQTFITGSLYLVGTALALLGKDMIC
jgi:folylpolyglutamate synthase/dihydropteroate synthase